MKKRVYNFSAGPSMLPLAVLEKAGAGIADHNGTGMSVMEMSHRSPPFEEIIAKAEASLRELMDIPANYKVLFLQGGASMQFSAVPLNLLPEGGTADYVDTGNFAALAYKEAQRYGNVRVAASSKEANYTTLPDLPRSVFNPDAAYVHITGNNTIYGTRYAEWPDTGDVPLVCDLSSSILSEPIDVRRFGLIYAGAQKNMAPAGLTVVIVREDLMGRARACTPTLLDYAVQAKSASMYNTPPSWCIYMLSLVLDWVKDLGGLAAMRTLNQEKAAILYDCIDASKAFTNNVDKRYRSLMNVPFVLPTAELDDRFVKEAAKAGLVTLKGHRAVGGMRASIYNAMPRQGIEALADFMRAFEAAL